MFWRFGFHNASAIDSLLDRDDVALESILDEDDLLQECKAQNTRLIDYFQRVDVLQRLLGYVTGQIEGEEAGRFKYPYVATEVLCSEIWSIVETCMNHSEELLVPFWNNVLDRSPEDMQTQMVMASHFAKINAVFLTKKPAEASTLMLAFIQSQRAIVERLIRHIETPSFVDLIVRIIQLDEHPAGAGVLEWLSQESLMGRLIALLSPEHSSDMHTVVAELIKGIISIASPSPAAGLGEGLQNGPASNRFARELARRDSVSKLVEYILHDFSSEGSEIPGDSADSEPPSPGRPNLESSTSSVVNSISVLIELIRKNNSDYFEPYLFHTLRNRLIQIQQQQAMQSGEDRDALEQAMKEMVDRMGVVHLGAVLEIISEHLEKFQRLLRNPRSSKGTMLTTVGPIVPFTFERFRICELYAELLHCSNMAILNRPPQYAHLYDADGRLQGGLSALEELAQVIAMGSGEGGGEEAADDDEDEMEPAAEFPVSGAPRMISAGMDSDEDMSGSEPGSSDDDAMEEIAMYDEAGPSSNSTSALSLAQGVPARTPSPSPSPSQSPSSSPSEGAPHMRQNSASPVGSLSDTPRPHLLRSRRGSRRTLRDSTTSLSKTGYVSVGEKLKRRFLEVDVLSTLLDLFFEFPWNNFAHTVVYDTVHQVLIGRLDSGGNRDLTISLFRDARLMHRIVEGQKRNDEESAKPKGLRLGYMGHLTLLAEDVISALEHYPADLRLTIEQFAPKPDWEEYVTGRFNETKQRDTSLLGGGKPVIASGPGRPGERWTVDEAESAGGSSGASSSTEAGTMGEFRRATSTRPTRENSADFGVAPMDEEGEDEDGAGSAQFARYLASEIQSSHQYESSSDASDEDDEDGDGGWLARSHFDLGPPPARQNAERRTPSGFDDTFGATTTASSFDDPFSADDDDTFGPFSDSAAASGSDPFSYPSTLSAQIEDATSFDSFGDFGDFQAAPEDGELTPTGGSWTFASDTASAGDGSESVGSDDFAFMGVDKPEESNTKRTT
ncbi:SAPS-domain-containing protein [Punctularia strigosozonata HHB-11173 SS5]|uniref:SAPS-domain-containing protein n=1 Tax=Punctularia strigosozonata (strain HHB-11173) TaxID=741275 RepID=UPI0004416AC9|nr:SAPS-domain-containing protein [Punctularia strigosozonata HHB-11173 SS5]EIN06991.1 SAPS-domain-containing protein [Punctularia strigosozonata HHB-11173 SS5]